MDLDFLFQLAHIIISYYSQIAYKKVKNIHRSMFLTRKNRFIQEKAKPSEIQNQSLSKKKTYLTVVTKSKSKDKYNSNENSINQSMQNSNDKLRNIGSQTAIELSQLPSEKAIVKSKREVFLLKSTRGNKIGSLILNNLQFEQYSIQQNDSLWNKDSPINRLSNDIQTRMK